MRSLTCVAVLLFAGVALHAADQPKPNTLTPQEAADGWLLLFDGETTFGWKIDGDAAVRDGALVLGGDKATVATVTTAFGSCDWQFDHSVLQGTGVAKVSVTGVTQGGGTTSATSRIGTSAGSQTGWLHANGSMAGGGRAVRSEVRVEVPAGARFSLRNFKLRPTGLKSLFNGKDLAGWKKYEADPKRAKAEFTVSEKGELCVKDGPGDLQTEGEWADFILQIGCISNGKNLNSGVFFRCQPGQYQQGYEAQIHNGFPDRLKTYTIEEYDPETHVLKGKRMVASAAEDYGTGAIYRRVPARFGVAKDQEWFTMTVAADGRHLATWVNGIQVTDWTDNRPQNDNARNGCRLEKGPISLQAHDKTTDLCFRNIRIAELPADKK
jgi:hypothetical protein